MQHTIACLEVSRSAFPCRASDPRSKTSHHLPLNTIFRRSAYDSNDRQMVLESISSSGSAEERFLSLLTHVPFTCYIWMALFIDGIQNFMILV